MLTNEQHAAVAGNREAWNDSARYHRESQMWKWLLENVHRTDFSCFDATATSLLTTVGVREKDIIQIACNNGRECLSLRAMGARSVVGIDQSEAFIAQARELSALSPHHVDFLDTDIHRLPDSLRGCFDVALVTIGVLGWMPSLPVFFAAAAETLRPGGTLVIYETHPVLEMFNPRSENPLEVSMSYFRDDIDIDDGPILYEGQTDDKVTTSYWYIHTLGDIITASVEAGLQPRSLREYPHSNREAAYRVFTERNIKLPMCYTLVAEKRQV